jgi:Tyrosine phosphatase family
VIRRVPFAGALNFRDIGGYPITGGGATRWGAVYRSDSLHYLTADDLKVFDALGVKAIYDLRRSRAVTSERGRPQSCGPAGTVRSGSQATTWGCSPARRGRSGSCSPAWPITSSFPR